MNVNDKILELSKQLGVQISPASARDAVRMETEISKPDQFDLSNTWRKDWRSELYSTIINSDYAYQITHPEVDGFLLFGLNKNEEGFGQIWMLQSDSMRKHLNINGNTKISRKFLNGVRGAVNIFLDECSFVYNFIHKTQTDTINWLKWCGFIFFDRSDIQIDYYMFAAGAEAKNLSTSKVFWESHLGDLA